MKQATLAQKSNLAIRTIAKVEAGKEDELVEVETLVAIATIYDVPVFELVHPDYWQRLPDHCRPPVPEPESTLPVEADTPSPPASLPVASPGDSLESSPSVAPAASVGSGTQATTDRRTSQGWRVTATIGIFLLLSLGAAALISSPLFNVRDEAGEHYRKGLAYYDQKMWEPAIGEFSLAAKKAPGYADALHMLGLTYALNGDFLRARHPLEEATQQNPRIFGAFTNLGWVLRELKDYDGALRALTTVIEDLKPADTHLAKAYQNRGDVYRDKCGTDHACLEQAIADYRNAIRLDPQDAFFSYRGLADVYKRLGQEENEAAALESAQRLAEKR